VQLEEDRQEEEELALDTRYQERCCMSGRGPKGLLPLPRAFLLSPECSTFL